MVFDLLFHFIILNCLSTDSSCIFKCFLGWILRFMTFYSFFVEIASRPDTRVAKLISTRRMSIFWFLLCWSFFSNLVSSLLLDSKGSSFMTQRTEWWDKERRWQTADSELAICFLSHWNLRTKRINLSSRWKGNPFLSFPTPFNPSILVILKLFNTNIQFCFVSLKIHFIFAYPFPYPLCSPFLTSTLPSLPFPLSIRKRLNSTPFFKWNTIGI